MDRLLFVDRLCPSLNLRCFGFDPWVRRAALGAWWLAYLVGGGLLVTSAYHPKRLPAWYHSIDFRAMDAVFASVMLCASVHLLCYDRATKVVVIPDPQEEEVVVIEEEDDDTLEAPGSPTMPDEDTFEEEPDVASIATSEQCITHHRSDEGGTVLTFPKGARYADGWD